MKKLKIMLLVIIASFSFFLMSYFKKRDYQLKYNVGKYKVSERYIKKDKNYVVSVNKGEDEYSFIIKEKYSKSRKLVSGIKLYKNEDEKCLKIAFNNKKVFPSCKSGEKEITFHLVNDSLKKKIGYKAYVKDVSSDKFEFKNIKVKSLNDKKILVWNYNGFYLLNKKESKNIKLFKTDVYSPTLVAQIDNYLVIPDYNESYEYNKFVILNVNNLDSSLLEVDKSISSDAYFLGINDESIFIYDPKYERELEIVPSKSKHRFVNPYIYENGKLITKTHNYLANNKAEFTYDTTYNYTILSGKLYRTNKYSKVKELISNQDIKSIVKKDNDVVYYLSANKLLMYSDKTGEKILLEYDELNFNYKNNIFIFN